MKQSDSLFVINIWMSMLIRNRIESSYIFSKGGTAISWTHYLRILSSDFRKTTMKNTNISNVL